MKSQELKESVSLWLTWRDIASDAHINEETKEALRIGQEMKKLRLRFDNQAWREELKLQDKSY